MSVPVRLAAGEQRLALSTPSGAGADLRLASENPAIVAIEVREHGMGAADLTLVAKAPGSARVHYVNRSMLPRDPVKRAQIDYIRAASLGSFLVTVK
ncbi:hypothetical protein [Niveibacterium umoris]|nr:hypothetical protein [Niveibacterium umoris]